MLWASQLLASSSARSSSAPVLWLSWVGQGTQRRLTEPEPFCQRPPAEHPTTRRIPEKAKRPHQNAASCLVRLLEPLRRNLHDEGVVPAMTGQRRSVEIPAVGGADNYHAA